MSPNPALPQANRPQRVAPIIPAIPRSFEKRAKEQIHCSSKKDLSSLNASAAEPRISQAEDRSSEAGQSLQIEISGELNSKEGAAGIDDSENRVAKDSYACPVDLQQSKPFPGIAACVDESSQPPAKNGATEDIGFEQPPSCHPKISSSTAILTEAALPYLHRGTADQPEPTTTNFEKGDQNHDPQSGQNYAPVVHTHPPLDTRLSYPDTNSSRAQSVYKENLSSGHLSFPLHDASGGHIESSEHLIEHQRNFSSHTTTYASSNTASSPTPSIQQGQLDRPSYEFLNQSPSHIRYEPQHGFDQRKYYGPPPPPAFNGNQPPFTPSANPLAFSFQRSDLSPARQSPFFPDHQYSIPFPLSDETFHYDPHGPTMSNRAHSHPPLPYLNNVQRGASVLGQSEMNDQVFDASATNLSLPSHVLKNFNLGTFADCRLLMTHEHDRFAPARFSLHSLLLAQSPKLRSFLANGHYSYDFDGLKLVRLRFSDRFITPVALEAALRVCYGEPVTSFTGSNAKSQMPRTKADFSACWMKESIAFTAAGVLLQLHDVVLRGLEIAGKIINWENLEHAISFALEGAAHRKHSASASVIPNGIVRCSYDSETSTTTTILTPDTSQASTDRSHDSRGIANGLSPTSSPPALSVYGADDLLFRCLRFLGSHLPNSWQFDPTAQPLAHVDRLPVTAESRSPLAKSRLSKIQFGDLPTELAIKASSRDVFVSSIVLSVPFSTLQSLVLMEGQLIKQHIYQIIEERERRRMIVVRSRSVNQAQREVAKYDEWIEVGYQEYVEVVDEDARLARRFFDIFDASADMAA
ncbi:MAG: hypothetical protein Q9164_000666 [Protoblastenia rupestris]